MADLPRCKFIAYPALWLATAFAGGILVSRFVPVDATALAIASICLAVLSFAIRRSRSWRIAIILAFLTSGAAAYQIQQRTAPDRIKLLYDAGIVASGQPVEVEGILKSRPEASIDGSFLTLTGNKLRARGADRSVSGTVRIFVPETGPESEIPNLKYGSRVRVTCALEREDEFRNPGVLPKREIMDRLGIDATCTLKSPLLIEHIADESVLIPLAWVYNARADLIDLFRQNLDPKTAGVMIASLLGDKYFLDKETAELFRDGGTFHILVISGLHITFIGGLLLLILRRFTRNRWLQFAVTITTLWAYTLAVGADVPVVRAAIMFTIVLLGYAIHRTGTTLNSLGACAIILLAWRPADLFDPSFQLTFVSVSAIAACAYPLIDHLRSIGEWRPSPTHPFPPNVAGWLGHFCETLYWQNESWQVEKKRQIWSARLVKSPILKPGYLLQKLLRYLFEALLVSLIVQIWMLPLSVAYFHRVSVASVILNLWVSFFIAIESFAAVLGAVVTKLSLLLAAGFFAIADICNWLMLTLPRLLSPAGWAGFRLPAYVGSGRVFYLVYFVPVLILSIMVIRWNPFSLVTSARWRVRLLSAAGCTLALLAGVIVFHPFRVAPADGRLHIDFLDVGQGDSALITFPNGQTLLVDGGGQIAYRSGSDEAEPFQRDVRGIGEAVVSEVLWAKGYSRIDRILATHADADHIQGLNDVVRNFAVGSAIFGRTPLDDPDYAALAATLKSRRIPIETVASGDLIHFGDVAIEVVYPFAATDVSAPSDNDHSVVLRVVFGNRSFLLTGDIEQRAERELLSTGVNLGSDLIKVPHHGSRTSSIAELVTAVRPSIAIISVGRHSPFGHPHAEVIERWRNAGARIMTTGEYGMISISTDGSDLSISTFASP